MCEEPDIESRPGSEKTAHRQIVVKGSPAQNITVWHSYYLIFRLFSLGCNSARAFSTFSSLSTRTARLITGTWYGNTRKADATKAASSAQSMTSSSNRNSVLHACQWTGSKTQKASCSRFSRSIITRRKSSSHTSPITAYTKKRGQSSSS